MTDQTQDQDVELDENIDEAHDPKNAESQSFAANDKAEDAGPKAKPRKGDKKKSDPMQKVTAGKTVKAESIEINGDFSDDLNALVESEATLSEEFKAKTAVIFEAAVKSKISEEINRLEAEYAEQLAEAVEVQTADLTEKVDSYLNYVVETWMEENKLAIQSGLRSEIAEGFMSSLKDLFVESYIEVPEGKVDLVDDLATANEELEEKLNVEVATAIELSEELISYKREAVIREASKDLAETQIEKLKSLAESVAFESVENFTSKVATLKESYFAKKSTAAPALNEESSDGSDEPEVHSALMEQYLTALRKT